MKFLKTLAIIFIVFSTGIISAQKHDYVWLSGYDSYIGYSSHWGFYFGTSVTDFNYPQVQVSYDSLKMNFDKTTTSYSDSDGRLMFYTNGIYVANGINQKIDNSDSMNAGWLQYGLYPEIETYGYRTAQGIIVIPNPGISGQYYIFHSFQDSVNSPGNLLCTKTLVTLLDMNLNAGLGKVLYKNLAVVNGSLGPQLTATRHGNGRDWWLLVQIRASNCYYPILVNDSGITVKPITCAGLSVPDGDAGAVCFSPDGNKYAYMSYAHGVDIFDFDRCSGTLSNPLNIPIQHNGWAGIDVAVSPNNRFLYVAHTYLAYQFDLTANDITASLDTIAIYDNVNAPFPALFNTAQNAPDGKIYISCGNGDTVYHVINDPDLKGDSCHFLQRGLPLESPSLGVPNFPNYRLGALRNSACDTLSLMTNEVREGKEKILKAFPNPASNVLTIDYGFTDWNKGEIYLEIINELGQPVFEQKMPMYSGYQRIDVSKFTAGIYTANIKRTNANIDTTRFVKQ